jgi:hypothetical protein
MLELAVVMPAKAAQQFGTIRGQVSYKTFGRRDVDRNEMTVSLEGPALRSKDAGSTRRVGCDRRRTALSGTVDYGAA